jgi:glutamate-5-semialdehyde dehydrogenase
MSLHEEMLTLGRQAVAASRELTRLTSRKKNALLEQMANGIEQSRSTIQEANALDLEEGQRKGLSGPMLDRLTLTDARVDGMVKGIRDIVALKDPVGQEISSWMRPNGLEISKVRVPIGVIGIIYESRPNVTADAAALCFKTSNAVILRGGSEAVHSNRAIADALCAGGTCKGMPAHDIQLVGTTNRKAVKELVQMEGMVDVIIPRGGEGLIRAVTEMARVPVLKHYTGNCHTYVDASADLEQALAICENAKCQRPGVCNAMETVVIHREVAPTFLPQLAERLGVQGVELRGDEEARGLVTGMTPATEDDWYKEYLELILAVRIVPDVMAAIDHINTYGSHHSDAIVAKSEEAQNAFTKEVDSATVYVNASTRFTDGAEFGMGAEMGISTDKLHARGPVGLQELTTYKFVIHGKGQVRS